MTRTLPIRSEATLDTTSASQPAKPKAAAREHVAYIDYARAVAILLIVCGHTYSVAWSHFIDEDPQQTVTWLNMVPAIITGGTAFFVFISGFLYRQVFYGRVPFSDFMRKKALYVGLPYLVLGTPLALAQIALGTFSVTVAKDGIPYDSNVFIDYMVLMTTGRMVTAYWYIPFIFIVFLASPLFDAFIRMSKGIQFTVLALAIGMALWAVRPADNLNPAHSFVYFVNFYLFGILFCEYRRPIMARLTSLTAVGSFAAVVLAIALVQALVLKDPGNIERLPSDGWGFAGLDLMLIQKYAVIAFLCGALARWGAYADRPLRFIADNSFGLFFMHGIVLAILMRLPAPLSPHVGEPMADLAIYTVIVVAWSMLIVALAKKLTGRYSRYVIGC